MSADLDVGNAHLRLARTIDKLFDKIPGVTIIASTLLPRNDPVLLARTAVYNGNIAGMVRTRQLQGRKILYVDFSSSWFGSADLHDDGYVLLTCPQCEIQINENYRLHPNDYGYQKMAAVWHRE